MYFGFSLVADRVLEISPELFDFASKDAKRLFFISQYNACVDEALKIPSSFVKEGKSLYHIFVDRISFLSKDASFLTCQNSQKVLKYFFERDFISLEHFCFTHVVHPAAKLIQMIYAKEEKGLLFDAKIFFSNYVYDKICRKHQDKQVNLKDGLIVVSKDGVDIMGIMPCFKYISKDDVAKANDDIRKAYEFLGKIHLEKLFIAYPRNEEFTKHVLVKQNVYQIHSRLTLVPYSISSRVVCKSHNIY